MKRADIQDRLEAIVEDLHPTRRTFMMRDELDTYFTPEELDEFFVLVGEEFEVDEEWLRDNPPANFFVLIDWIEEEIN